MEKKDPNDFDGDDWDEMKSSAIAALRYLFCVGRHDHLAFFANRAMINNPEETEEYFEMLRRRGLRHKVEEIIEKARNFDYNDHDYYAVQNYREFEDYWARRQRGV